MPPRCRSRRCDSSRLTAAAPPERLLPAGRRLGRATARRFPPADPGTLAYDATHRALVSSCSTATSGARASRLAPSAGGARIGFDERVVEYPWLFSRDLSGRVLDAGSVLNHRHLVERLLPGIDDLTIVTLGARARGLHFAWHLPSVRRFEAAGAARRLVRRGRLSLDPGACGDGQRDLRRGRPARRGSTGRGGPGAARATARRPPRRPRSSQPAVRSPRRPWLVPPARPRGRRGSASRAGARATRRPPSARPAWLASHCSEEGRGSELQRDRGAEANGALAARAVLCATIYA